MLELVFIGRLEDPAGASERRVPYRATIAQVIASLEPELQSALSAPRVRLAINGALIESKAITLVDGDEIAFLAPVSGG